MGRPCRVYEANGKVGSISQHAQWSGVGIKTIQRRIREGMTMEAATANVAKPKKWLAFGKRSTLSEHARRHGMDPEIVRERVRRGWTITKALTVPVKRDFLILPTDEYQYARITIPWEHDLEAQRLVREHPDGMTLEQVGKVMGLGKERVRQIEESAMAKLRKSKHGTALLVAMLSRAVEDHSGPYSLRG